MVAIVGRIPQLLSLSNPGHAHLYRYASGRRSPQTSMRKEHFKIDRDRRRSTGWHHLTFDAAARLGSHVNVSLRKQKYKGQTVSAGEMKGEHYECTTKPDRKSGAA